MRIRDEQGRLFDLFDDVHIRLKRPNPFFSEYAGHSLPLRLPDTDANRRLLDFPFLPGKYLAVGKRIPVTLEDGGFVFRAMMVIRSYSPVSGFDCTFLLSDGTLYDRMRSLKTSDVLAAHRPSGAHAVPGGWRFDTMSVAVGFLADLSDSNTVPAGPLCVLPGMIEEVQINEPKNRNGQLYGLAADEDRILTINGKKVKLPAGFLLSPFIRLTYVLRVLFGHLGFTVSDWGELGVAPWSDLYVLNNNYDTVANAEIRLSQLVPDMPVTDFLHFVELRFCARWVVDDALRTVRFVSFPKLLAADAPDLSAFVSENRCPKISYPSTAKFLTVACKEQLNPRAAREGYSNPETLSDFLRLTASSSCDARTGIYYQYAVDGLSERLTAVCSSSLPHAPASPGDVWKAEKIELPDTSVALELVKNGVSVQLGSGRWINSYVLLPDHGKQEEKASVQRLMLAFARVVDNRVQAATEIDGCSLSPGLAGGTYDRFYRSFDGLMRGSMYPVSHTLQLPAAHKLSISSVLPVYIDGQRLLPKLYNLSTEPDSLSEVEFLTTQQIGDTDTPPIPQTPTPNGYTWLLGYDPDTAGKNPITSPSPTLSLSKWKPITELIESGFEEDKEVRLEGDIITVPAPKTDQVDSGLGYFVSVMKVNIWVFEGYVALYVKPVLLSDRLKDMDTLVSPPRGNYGGRR